MVVVDGVRHKLVKGKANREEAKRRLREIQTLRDKAPSQESRDLTVAGVIELYLAHQGKQLDERTLYGRKPYLQSFAEAHGFRKATELETKPFHLTSWLDENPQIKSDWTKVHVIAVLQRPFNWAVRQRLIPTNPFRGVSHRVGEPRRPMTDDELEKLLVGCEGRRSRQIPSPAERFRELLRFLRLSGARTCEASRLTWPDIDLDHALIVLKRHKTSRMQREPKPGAIPLVPELVQLLVAIRKRGEPGDHVFHNHRGTPWNRCSLSLRMQRAREKAGIPEEVKLYGLRHAFGTRAVVSGVDIKTLAELMGHTPTRITEHYVHLAGQRSHLADAMRRVNGQGPTG
jgi:integrase